MLAQDEFNYFLSLVNHAVSISGCKQHIFLMPAEAIFQDAQRILECINNNEFNLVV